MPKRSVVEGASEEAASASQGIVDKKKKVQTPYDAYFARLQALRKEKGNVIGQLLVKGMPRPKGYNEDEDDSPDEEERKKANSEYTEKQMSSLRFVLITQNRADQLDEMRKLVLGDQADDGFLCFNTSFSCEVYDGFFFFKEEIYGKLKSWPKKFDMLFAYTYTLKEHDVWMHDNEGDMDDMVASLAKLWKALLKKDNETLGIDAEYTRPGVLHFLGDFKKQVENAPTEPPFKFRFK